jgi:hypothetical protein
MSQDMFLSLVLAPEVLFSPSSAGGCAITLYTDNKFGG